MEHRNSASEVTLIAMLAEESAEVVKEAMKALRFGLFSPSEEGTAQERLELEIGDVEAILTILKAKGIVSRTRIEQNRVAKHQKLMTGTDNLGRPLIP